MSKKRVEVTEGELSEMGETSPPAEEVIEEVLPSGKEEKPYTLGTWGGRRQWKCRLCPWDTLKGEAEMLKHVALHTPPKPRTGILVADKSGRIIT